MSDSGPPRRGVRQFDHWDSVLYWKEYWCRAGTAPLKLYFIIWKLFNFWEFFFDRFPRPEKLQEGFFGSWLKNKSRAFLSDNDIRAGQFEFTRDAHRLVAPVPEKLDHSLRRHNASWHMLRHRPSLLRSQSRIASKNSLTKSLRVIFDQSDRPIGRGPRRGEAWKRALRSPTKPASLWRSRRCGSTARGQARCSLRSRRAAFAIPTPTRSRAPIPRGSSRRSSVMRGLVSSSMSGPGSRASKRATTSSRSTRRNAGSANPASRTRLICAPRSARPKEGA